MLKTRILQNYSKFIKYFDKFSGFETIKWKKLQVEKSLEILKRSKEDFRIKKIEFEKISEERKTHQQDLDALRDRAHLSPDGIKLSNQDISRLTQLYHSIHTLSQSESQSRQAYKLSLDAYEKAQEEYLNDMRERYIEEQVYSDRVRQASTYWTWMWVEPRKKKELKESLKEMLDKQAVVNKDLFESIVGHVADKDSVEAMKLQPTNTKYENQKIKDQHTMQISSKEIEELKETMKSPSFLSGLATGTFLTIILSLISS